MKLLDGKLIAQEIQREIKDIIQKDFTTPPTLAVILVGTNAASEIYIKRKRLACEEVGIRSILIHLQDDISEAELLRQINICNDDSSINGILVQMPLPKQINPHLVTRCINPTKDVDGFHPINAGKLLNGETDGFIPCTPLGVKVMLERSGIQVSGKHVLVLGRSNIVGKPMAALLMQNAPGCNATVTIAHSRTQDLTAISRTADIIVAAIGQPRFVTAGMIKEGAVVVDVGINKIANSERPSGYQIVGDVDFDSVKDKCSYITPVPGGVGPLTIAMLLSNTLSSAQKQHD